MLPFHSVAGLFLRLFFRRSPCLRASTRRLLSQFDTRNRHRVLDAKEECLS